MAVDILLTHGNDIHIGRMAERDIFRLVGDFSDSDVSVLTVALDDPDMVVYINKQHVITIETSEGASNSND